MTAPAASIRRSLALAALCVLLWSFIPVFARLGQADLDQYQYLCWSNLVSLAVVSPVLLKRGVRAELGQIVRRRWQLAAALVIGMLDGLYYLLLYFGYAHENAYVINVAQYTWPLLVALLSVLLLGERPDACSLAAIGLGFLALLITITHGRLVMLAVSHPLAVGLTLVGAFCFALLSVLSKRAALPAMAGTWLLFLASLALSLLLVVTASRLQLPSPAAWPAILINGGLVNGLSYILWIEALRLGAAVKVAALVFLTPVLAAIWMFLLFHEPLHPSYLLGIALATGSGLLITMPRKT